MSQPRLAVPVISSNVESMSNEQKGSRTVKDVRLPLCAQVTNFGNTADIRFATPPRCGA